MSKAYTAKEIKEILEDCSLSINLKGVEKIPLHRRVGSKSTGTYINVDNNDFLCGCMYYDNDLVYLVLKLDELTDDLYLDFIIKFDIRSVEPFPIYIFANTSVYYDGDLVGRYFIKCPEKNSLGYGGEIPLSAEKTVAFLVERSTLKGCSVEEYINNRILESAFYYKNYNIGNPKWDLYFILKEGNIKEGFHYKKEHFCPSEDYDKLVKYSKDMHINIGDLKPKVWYKSGDTFFVIKVNSSSVKCSSYLYIESLSLVKEYSFNGDFLFYTIDINSRTNKLTGYSPNGRMGIFRSVEGGVRYIEGILKNKGSVKMKGSHSNALSIWEDWYLEYLTDLEDEIKMVFYHIEVLGGEEPSPSSPRYATRKEYFIVVYSKATGRLRAEIGLLSKIINEKAVKVLTSKMFSKCLKSDNKKYVISIWDKNLRRQIGDDTVTDTSLKKVLEKGSILKNWVRVMFLYLIGIQKMV